VRTLLLIVVVAIAASACLSTEDGDDDATPELGSGSGSGSGVVSLVVSTPRDHSLEWLVAASSVAVVVVPSLRRKRGNDAPRPA
jgi:hypothetical protein